MRGKILVTYASLKGSTTGVASTIGDELAAGGETVDVVPMGLVTRLYPYSAVVIGSAIYNARWLDQAVEFLHIFREPLSKLPVAYFVVCLTMKDDTAEHRRVVQSYLDPVLETIPDVKPVSVGAFAGAFDSRQWPLVILLSLKSRGELPADGDHRDWRAVRRWAQAINPLLTQRVTPAATLG
jgi:menaquinone-dependent protoporphyrinogen oxidase